MQSLVKVTDFRLPSFFFSPRVLSETLDLSFSQEVIRGTVHSHSDTGNVSFVPITPSSCQVHGYIITDKVGGNFKFKVKSASEDLVNDLFVQQFGQQFGQITRGVKETDPDLRSPLSSPRT
jgi:hypothetical protein